MTWAHSQWTSFANAFMKTENCKWGLMRPNIIVRAFIMNPLQGRVSLTKGDQLTAQLADIPKQLIEAFLWLVAVRHEAVEHLLQLTLNTRTLLHHAKEGHTFTLLIHLKHRRFVYISHISFLEQVHIEFCHRHHDQPFKSPWRSPASKA